MSLLAILFIFFYKSPKNINFYMGQSYKQVDISRDRPQSAWVDLGLISIYDFAVTPLIASWSWKPIYCSGGGSNPFISDFFKAFFYLHINNMASFPSLI